MLKDKKKKDKRSKEYMLCYGCSDMNKLKVLIHNVKLVTWNYLFYSMKVKNWIISQ